MSAEEQVIDADRMTLLKESNHEIYMVADGIKRLLAIERNDDFLMYHGMLCRIQQLSEMQFYALRLHGDGPEAEKKQWGQMTEFSNQHRIFDGMLV